MRSIALCLIVSTFASVVDAKSAKKKNPIGIIVAVVVVVVVVVFLVAGYFL